MSQTDLGSYEDSYIDRNAKGKIERPEFDELSFAIIRNHPEDVAKHLVAGLPRSWIIDVANWIDRFFGPRKQKRGRGKTAPIDRTIADAWLNARAKERKTVRSAAGLLGWTEPDRNSSERGHYTGVSPRSIARARKIVREI